MLILFFQLNILNKHFDQDEFAYVGDEGLLYSNVNLTDQNIKNILGCKFLIKL